MPPRKAAARFLRRALKRPLCAGRVSARVFRPEIKRRAPPLRISGAPARFLSFPFFFLILTTPRPPYASAMKFASTLLLLAPLVSAGLVPSRSYVMPFQPPIHPAMLRNVTDETVAPLLTKLVPRTNGQRMAHGLSPLPPRTFGRRTHLIKQRQNRVMHGSSSLFPPS
jgi:hypothetical protein